jgi:hypothetical protein
MKTKINPTAAIQKPVKAKASVKKAAPVNATVKPKQTQMSDARLNLDSFTLSRPVVRDDQNCGRAWGNKPRTHRNVPNAERIASSRFTMSLVVCTSIAFAV